LTPGPGKSRCRSGVNSLLSRDREALEKLHAEGKLAAPDVRLSDTCSLVPSLDANNSAKRLGTLICKGCVNLVSNGICGLVAKLRRWKSVDLLRGRLRGTAKDDPLQRYNENPFHELLHSCRRAIIGFATTSEPNTTLKTILGLGLYGSQRASG
jgi:hypothetical protein